MVHDVTPTKQGETLEQARATAAAGVAGVGNRLGGAR